MHITCQQPYNYIKIFLKCNVVNHRALYIEVKCNDFLPCSLLLLHCLTEIKRKVCGSFLWWWKYDQQQQILEWKKCNHDNQDIVVNNFVSQVSQNRIGKNRRPNGTCTLWLDKKEYIKKRRFEPKRLYQCTNTIWRPECLKVNCIQNYAFYKRGCGCT